MKSVLKGKMKKLLAMLLVVAMTVGYLPVMTNAAEFEVSNKVADPQTLNNWQDYYGDNSLLPDGSRGTSTWKAGGVWTDKSVFASDADISAAGLPTGLEDPNAFLVSLSALASTKDVLGQSSVPTDTMLVLDLSNSMDNSRSVPSMIAAANETIATLLEMNVNNRVGVVLYSGNSRQGSSAKNTATVILPLDHYTTTSNSGGKAQYLSVSGSSDTTVSVASGTRNSNNQRPTGSKNTVGGTYIQNGLFQAYEQFTGTADKGVVQSGAQKGIQRTPILVLMSDGAPTAATEDYYNVATSNVGDGTSTTDQITFLTQLTAAWVKGKIGAYYNNTTAQFYTLGLGTSNDANATAVLYPAGSNNTLSGYWNTFNNSSNGREVTIGSGGSRITVQVQDAAQAVGKNYVDMYKSAANADDLIEAFKEIVDEIGLQSAYTATLVESGEADLDGYITVEDELGSMMVVKDVKGILLGDSLFSGAEFAKSMNAGELGDNAGNATAYGNEFINTVKERLNIDTSTAQQLVNAAYLDGQLGYTSDSNYANYLGWYGDANNAYLGFWDKDSGTDAAGAPAGAKYINKCYLYLGEAHSSDMMHVIVQVRTEIANGHQTVLFKIPASLIPLVRYHVELEGDSLETATDITLTVQETDPIRLLYEVGLPDDVNEVNLEQKVSEYLAKDGSNHIHKNADGSYTFYANSWGADHEVAPNIPGMSDTQKQALTKSVAESHFIPNTANERFYIQEDALIYTKSGDSYVQATGAPVAGQDYYFVRTIVNVTGANGKAEAVQQYEQLHAATVSNANNFKQNADGDWVVKAGTIRQTLSSLGLAKASNNTNTIATSDQLWVHIEGAAAQDHNIYSFLGNNGKLTVMPTSGIKVTKELTELAEGQSADEKFTIVVTLSQAAEALQVTDADGNALSAESYAVSGNAITLYLADGETAYLAGLTVGTTYTVAEQHDKYIPSYLYDNEDKTVRAGYIDGVTVTNEPIKNGTLFITKEVEPYKNGEPFPTDREFTFAVTFWDAEGNPIANTEFKLVNNHDPSITARTTDENGVMTGWLRHGETVHILGIPAGAAVTVEEVLDAELAQYYAPAYESTDFEGDAQDNDGAVTIGSSQDATVIVTNTYTPKSAVVDLDIAGTKNFEVEGLLEAQHAGSFTFVVEKWNGQSWSAVENKTATLSYAEGEGGSIKNFTIENVLEGVTFTEAGTYTYQVREQIGTVENVTYDRTLWTFTVTVTDVNGQLTATVTDLNNVAITDGSYEVSFINTFHTAPVSIDIVKQVEDTTNNPLTSKAGFEFVAQTAEVDSEGNWSVKEGGRSFSVFSDGSGNAHMTDVYKTPGSYYYIISEKAGNAEGWTYSGVVYQIEAVVTEDAESGELTATLIVNGEPINGDSAQITFTNTYDPQDASVDLNIVPTVAKDLKGRDFEAGEFTFAIFPDGKASHTSTEGAVAVGTNDANGDVLFTGDMVFSKVGRYDYDVVEINGGLGGMSYDSNVYHLVVEVTDAGDGTLTAVYYFENSTEQTAVFTNTYTAQPTELVIEGMKTLQINSGWKELTAGMFTFGLYDSTGAQIATATNLANGSFAFDAIAYDMDDVGIHTYTVKEISGAAAGITYDTAEFTVTVEVSDNGDGTISAAATGNGAQNIAFVNTYRSNPVSVALSGIKTLAGRDLTAGEFTYAVYESDADFAQHTLVTDQITHDADGNITFELGTLGMGYHYFILKEVIPEERAAGIHYDASEYHVTVQVTDSGNGQMSAAATVKHTGDPYAENPAIAFKNVYRPDDTSVLIEGTKVLEGEKPLAADAFTFNLYDESGAQVGEAKVNADGTFAFDTLTFTADDIGTHTYTVKEQLPDGATAENGYVDGNITYDSTVYTVTVAVADNAGVLEVTKHYSVGEEAANGILFTNIHTPDPITYQLQAHKTYDKGLKGDDFTFKLEGQIAGEKIEQSKKNDASGNVVFDELSFPAEGTYTFTVKETDKILGFISYSVAEYEVTVTVVNEEGVLRVSDVTCVNTKNTNESNLEFVNTYVLDGEDTVVLSGVKTLTGDRTAVEAGEFEFGLYDASGALVESVSNDANGSFAFSALTFDEGDVEMNGEATFTYTVKEIAGNNARYTYDDAVYTVTVTVKDNDEGGIAVSCEITENGTAAEIAFENTYTDPDPVTYTPVAQKHYNKEMVGGEFTFKLEGEGFTSQEKTNTANGTVTFDALSFPEAGEYTFTVKEINKVLGFINYSAAEHTLVVKVIDTNGVLSIESVTVNADPNGTIEFTNVYTFDGEGQVALSGTKTLTGDRTAVEAGEFEFGLYDASGALVESVKNDADGRFAFSALTFDESDTTIDGENTIVYTVKEISGTNNGMTYDNTVYTVSVTVKDNDQGGITVSHEITENGTAAEIAFENTYTISGTGSAQIAGTKTYDGKTLQGNDFTFVLSDGTNELEQVKNAADGTFAFAPISYTKADIGTHTYTVSELRPDDAQLLEDGSYMKDGTIYDANVYTVEVTVADDGNGGLSVTQKVNNQAVADINVAFDNAYEIFGVGKLELDGTKTLTGGKPLADGAFAFGLYEGDTLIAQAENENGTFRLVKEYAADELGQYTYTVKEILPEGAVQNADGTWTLDNISYDPAVYTVSVTVADDQMGGITVSYDLEDAETITFENTYTPDDAVVTVEIQKILDNKTDKKVSLEGFRFEIACGKDVQATASDAEGKAGFEVTFSAAHIGQSYEFKVSEKNTGIKGMTYDKTVYTIKVQVQQNEDGTIKTVINGQTADKAAVQFTNVYEELVTPATGDTFNVLLPVALMLLSVLGVVAVVAARKKRAA